MKSRQVRKTLAVLLAVVLTAALPSFGSFSATERAQQAPAKVARVSVHDPSIIKVNGTYYIFGSHLADAKSSNLMSWQTINNDWNFRGGNNNWQNDSVYGKILTNLSESFKWAGYDDGDCSGGKLGVWAPDVIYNPNYKWSDGTGKGAYMLYYSASSTWNRSCIGYAVSKTVGGPYQYVNTIIYSGFTTSGNPTGNSSRNTKWDKDYLNLKRLINERRISDISNKWFSNGGYNFNYAPNAIDPTVFYGKDGKLYMVYGSWSGGLFVLELDEETGDPKYPGTDGTDSTSGNYIDRYFGTHIAGGNHQSGEGPYILYDEETDYYYMYETYGGLGAKEGYNMRLFRSQNVYGPYMDAAGRNARDSGVNNDNYGIKLIGNYAFSNQPGYRAAGHNSALIDDDGQRYLIYHQRFNQPGNQTEGHQVRVRKQYLNEDNWPVAAVYEYRGEEIGHYDDNAVVGKYEIINHGTSTDGNMIAPQSIELYADGTIDGDLSGTWKKTTDNNKEYDYITIKSGTVTYKGILYQQFNEENKNRSVMTFSAIGNNNTCLWGTRTGDATAIEPYGEHLIYGYDFEEAAVNGNLSPVAGSQKSGQAALKGTASIQVDNSRGKVLRIENQKEAKAVNYLRLPEDTLSTVTGKGYTVCMWVNVDASAWDHSSLFEANLNGQERNYPMTRIGVNLLARINASSNINADAYADGTEHAFSRNAWHHVAYSVNTEGIRTYLDGQLVEAVSKDISICFDTTQSGSIQKAVNVAIGSGHIFNDEDVRAASFDNIAIYDMTFSGSQIKELYTTDDLTPPAPTATPTQKPTATPTPTGTATTKPTPTGAPTVEPSTSPGGTVTGTPEPQGPSVQTDLGSVAEVSHIITSANTDKGDPKGSVFSVLRLNGKGGKKSVKLSWSKVANADGYIIYGAACGKKMKEISNVPAAKKSFTIKKLKQGKYYKYIVVAYKKTGAENRVLTQSKSVHVCTTGGKVKNPVRISVKKKLTLKKGKSKKLKPKLKSAGKVRVHIARFRYESVNTDIVTVNKKGKMKARKKGTGTVYVYSQNGLYAKVKVKIN